jgi:hypothetical protein
MATSNAHAAEAPYNCQQKLASQLVECLGHDGAIHVCKVNGWNGILDAIVAAEDGSPTHRGNQLQQS